MRMATERESLSAIRKGVEVRRVTIHAAIFYLLCTQYGSAAAIGWPEIQPRQNRSLALLEDGCSSICLARSLVADSVARCRSVSAPANGTTYVSFASLLDSVLFLVQSRAAKAIRRMSNQAATARSPSAKSPPSTSFASVRDAPTAPGFGLGCNRHAGHRWIPSRHRRA